MPAALLLFKAKVQGYDRVENVKHSKNKKKNPPHCGDYFKCDLSSKLEDASLHGTIKMLIKCQCSLY